MDYAPVLDLLEDRVTPAMDLFGFSGYGTPPPGAEISICDVPNDPYVQSGSLWGLTGAYGVGAPQAWDVTVGTTAVTVGVVDTGIDYNHPDLYKNVWLNQGEIPAAVKAVLTDTDGDGLFTFWDLNEPVNQGPGKVVDGNGDGRITAVDVLRQWSNGVSDDGDAYRDDLIGWDFANNDNDPIDDHSHGTHVSGTIGGVGNNALGVAGVNWKTQLMAVKMLSAGGSGSFDWGAQATVYAADHGARLTSNSWGGSGGSVSMANAVTYAEVRGVLFVAAAGNNGQNNDSALFYPASYPNANVISVAATDINGTRANFSNYGATTVDLGAPGVGIISTVPGGYASYSGTSMATPHVAGTAALVAGQHPDWSAGQVKARILATVTPLPSLTGKTVTGGLLSAADAVFRPDAPEAHLVGSEGAVRDGAGVVEVQTWPGVPVERTFTLYNLGSQPLSVGPVSAPAGWTVVSQPASSVAPDGSTAFILRLEAQAEGTYSGRVSFATDDPDENPYDFALTGVASNVVVLDDAEVRAPSNHLAVPDGFSVLGGLWTNYQGQGLGNDVHFAEREIGSARVAWRFPVLPGAYRVSVTWSSHPNRATNAPFTVTDGLAADGAFGSASLGTFRVNQEQAPDDRIDRGAAWEDLGVFNVAGDRLTVWLTNDADEYVIADAVRIERLPGPAPGPAAITIDNYEPAFFWEGSWQIWWYGRGAPEGYRGDHHFTYSAWGGPARQGPNDPQRPSAAYWVFSVEPGVRYKLSGTWAAGADRAAGVPVSVHDGLVKYHNGFPDMSPVPQPPPALGSFRVNQAVAPGDYILGGVAWEDFGVFTPTGNVLTVKLTNADGGFASADAFRLERWAGPDVPPPAGPPTGPVPAVQVVDDGDAGFSTSGAWSYWPASNGPQGLGGDVHYARYAAGQDTAFWRFRVEPSATYRVSATWSVHPNRAARALYLINDGNATVWSGSKDQRLAPDDFAADGSPWEDLGVVGVAGDSLVVWLVDQPGDGYVIADAVRVEKL